MKRLIRAALVSAAVVCASVPTYAGPFGLERGMTRDQVVAIVGQSAIIKEKPDRLGGEVLELSTVPKPHPMFEQYDLFISKQDGLLKIVAASKDIETSEDGADLSREFRDIRAALVSVYSKPENDFDFVKAGSLWTEPRDFMMGLLKKDRYLSSNWDARQGSALKDGIVILALDGYALSPDKGYIVLLYEFTGWEAYVDKVQAKESSVF